MTSIVSAISSLLTPETVGKLAAASGLDSYAAQSVVSAAVPSILSGLADSAATPAGARQLASAVAEQPADMLASITSSLAGSAQLAEKEPVSLHRCSVEARLPNSPRRWASSPASAKGQRGRCLVS